MNVTKQREWLWANQQYLAAALAVVRRQVARYAAATHGQNHHEELETDDPNDALEAAVALLPAPSALDRVCAIFDLSTFERDVLLLCAGVEMDGAFASLVGEAQGDWRCTSPTFSLALAALCDPDWGSLAPSAPLRYWRLISVAEGPSLTLAALKIDERILHYLAGIHYDDERLPGLVEPSFDLESLPPSHRDLAHRLAATWSESAETDQRPVLQLCGDEIASKRAIAGKACAWLGLDLKLLPAHALPTAPADLENWLRIWEREAALSQSVLLLDCDEIEVVDVERESAIHRLVERTNSLVIISGRQRRRLGQLSALTFDVDKPSRAEQRVLWREALGVEAEELDSEVSRLVFQFNLSAVAIHAVAAGARGLLALPNENATTPPVNPAEALWETCRIQARPRLDDLAERIAPSATWDDLILPPYQLSLLRGIAIQLRQRATVYESWGFLGKGTRGLGLSALFAGPSGTGKTMAAEVLAGELRLDLYRIDLSSVVSKYIGETEKNLHRVFAAAEEGGVILLFDEADALFGKRTEVKDSHDRYANVEVSYLLQRMESYRGLAILTTNLKEAVDQAFLRRLRFIVQFPFPDIAQRAEIWARIFPPATPTHGLDVWKLAQLNVAGGNIRNIALNAAFLAAEAGQPVSMEHLVQAARDEYAKLDKSLTEAEIRDWV